MLVFPEYEDSKIEFFADVAARSEADWDTRIEIAGTYDGPTQYVASRGYRLWWTLDEGQLLERGVAMLEVASGEFVASEWVSTITSAHEELRQLPNGGEAANVTISPFKTDGSTMSYEWYGKMSKFVPYPPPFDGTSA